MKFKFAAISLLTASALAAAPMSPASAHEYYHHRHGFPILGGLIGAGIAVGGAAVAVATAPVRIIADAATPYPYVPARAYAPAYYAARPAPYPVYAYPTYGYPVAPVAYRQPVYVYP